MVNRKVLIAESIQTATKLARGTTLNTLLAKCEKQKTISTTLIEKYLEETQDFMKRSSVQISKLTSELTTDANQLRVVLDDLTQAHKDSNEEYARMIHNSILEMYYYSLKDKKIGLFTDEEHSKAYKRAANISERFMELAFNTKMRIGQ